MVSYSLLEKANHALCEILFQSSLLQNKMPRKITQNLDSDSGAYILQQVPAVEKLISRVEDLERNQDLTNCPYLVFLVFQFLLLHATSWQRCENITVTLNVSARKPVCLHQVVNLSAGSRHNGHVNTRLLWQYGLEYLHI